MPKLVVGLGNPGPEYESTRHNAGFLTIDALANFAGASYWKMTGGAAIAVVTIKDTDGKSQEVILAKPQSFMNTSGGPVKNLVAEFGLNANKHPEDIIVVHDELDIPAGDVRIKEGGGHAGHNGLRSIHDKLVTDAYLRVRVGIGRPPGRMSVSDYVLSEPRGDDAEAFAVAVIKARDAVLSLL